jgi:hypothetical protein
MGGLSSLTGGGGLSNSSSASATGRSGDSAGSSGTGNQIFNLGKGSSSSANDSSWLIWVAVGVVVLLLLRRK